MSPATIKGGKKKEEKRERATLSLRKGLENNINFSKQYIIQPMWLISKEILLFPLLSLKLQDAAGSNQRIMWVMLRVQLLKLSCRQLFPLVKQKHNRVMYFLPGCLMHSSESWRRKTPVNLVHLPCSPYLLNQWRFWKANLWQNPRNL